MFFHSGGISGFFIAMFIIFVLVKLSSRASGYTRNQTRQNQRRNLRGGMFGPGFWGSYGPRNNFYDPNDPNNMKNPYGSNVPPSNFNPYGTPPTNSNPDNNFYAPPGSYYQPGTPPSSSFNWPETATPVNSTTTTTNQNVQPSASHTVRAWEMPDNQAVLKEAYVWVRSLGGWQYAGKLIVDGGMSQDDLKRYAAGKFGVTINDLVSIEAPSLEDARRVFEGYHLH